MTCKDLPCERPLRARQREDRQSRNVEDRRLLAPASANADVERRLDRMVADVGRVVAGAAESRNARDVEIVVEARNSGDVDVGVLNTSSPRAIDWRFGGVLVARAGRATAGRDRRFAR